MMGRDFVVYLAVGPVDLRAAVDRLSGIVAQVLSMDPSSGALFLFLNKHRNRLKALWWDRNGYIILYKRLAKGSFHIPDPAGVEQSHVELSAAQFSAILSGLPWDDGNTNWVH